MGRSHLLRGHVPGGWRHPHGPGGVTRGKWGGCLTSWGHQGILCPGLSPLAAFRAPLWGGQAGGAGEGSGPGRAGRCEAGPEFGLGGRWRRNLAVEGSGLWSHTRACRRDGGRRSGRRSWRSHGPPSAGSRLFPNRPRPCRPRTASRVSWLLISAVMALQLLLAGARSSRQSSRLHVFLIKNCFSAQSFTMARFNDWHVVTNH